MYRSTETGIWHDPKFKALGPEAKLLFFYFFTNPHSHLCGVYYLPRVVVPLEVGFDIDDAWNEITDAGMVEYDDTHQIVFVPKMFHYQLRKPNENQKKGVASHLATLHDHPLVGCFLKRYAECGIPYRYPFDRDVSDSETKDEDEDEERRQKRNMRKSRSSDRPTGKGSKTAPGPRKKSGDHKAFIDHFTAGWRSTFGRDYAFQGAKDGSAVGRILHDCDNVAEACKIADAFLADQDKFITGSGHTIAILSSQINRYLAGAHRPSSAGSDNGFVRAAMTPEIESLIEKAVQR